MPEPLLGPLPLRESAYVRYLRKRLHQFRGTHYGETPAYRFMFFSSTLQRFALPVNVSSYSVFTHDSRLRPEMTFENICTNITSLVAYNITRKHTHTRHHAYTRLCETYSMHMYLHWWCTSAKCMCQLMPFMHLMLCKS